MQITAQTTSEKVLGDDLALGREIAEQLIGKVHVPWNGNVDLSFTMSSDNLLSDVLGADQLH